MHGEVVAPKKLATVCEGVNESKGFEAYRLVNQEADPVMDNVALQMSMETSKLSTIRRKTAAETKDLVETLDQKRQ